MKSEFEDIRTFIFDVCGFTYTPPLQEEESIDYAAEKFELNGRQVIMRSAKVTPKKIGHFVTFWKRDLNRITTPYSVNDKFDLLIINVRNNKLFGQFVFSKSVLSDVKIIAHTQSKGKRGFRVYPPWDKVENKQALKTQQWQSKYFIDINNQLKKNLAMVKKLYAH